MIRVAMTSELSWQRKDAVTYFACSRISRHGEMFIQNRSWELSFYSRLDVREDPSLRQFRCFSDKFNFFAKLNANGILV